MNIPFDKLTLLDGAMGTNLIKIGMPQGVCPEAWILDNADVVENLQYDYIMSGADIIYAPTFGANSAVLARFGLENRVEDFNSRLIEITKRARTRAAKPALIAQDISPTGLFMKPFGDYTFDQIEQIYYEQAAVGEKSGVDLFVIETTISLAEAKAALSAVHRAAPTKPVLVTVTLEAADRTISGNGLDACLLTLHCAGAAAFGVNCSQGPVEMLNSMQKIEKYSGLLPIIAKPNAGIPTDGENGEKVYTLSPDDFAAAAKDLVKCGVRVLGGCCGTDAKYIEKLRALADAETVVAPPVCDISHLACNEKDVFEIPADAALPSPIACDADVADSIMDAEDDGAELLHVALENADAVEYLLENAYLINMPLVLNADFETLEDALRRYVGRAAISPDAPLTDEQRQYLMHKYNTATI